MLEQPVSTTTNSGVHVPRGTGPMHWVANDTYETKLSVSNTGGAVSTVDAFVPPGGGPPLHRHDLADEVFFLIEGELEFQCGEEVFEVVDGAAIFIPKGTPHRFRNISRMPAHMVFMHTPAGPEGVFLVTGAEVIAGQVAPEFIITPGMIEVFANHDTYLV